MKSLRIVDVIGTVCSPSDLHSPELCALELCVQEAIWMLL